MTTTDTPAIPKPNVSITSNVTYSVNPRVAGTESGRLQNDWLDCPFSICPSKTPSKGFQRGFAWEVTFVATDGKDPSKKFSGIAESRQIAMRTILNTITHYIATIIKQRREFIDRYMHAQQLSIRDGVPLAHEDANANTPVHAE